MEISNGRKSPQEMMNNGRLGVHRLFIKTFKKLTIDLLKEKTANTCFEIQF